LEELKVVAFFLVCLTAVSDQVVSVSQAAGINRKFAQTIGISVDHRRTNKSEESLNANVDRLKSYKARLVIFPRRAGVFKQGDSSAADIAAAQKTDVDVNALPKRADAVTFTTITEVLTRAVCC
jgi:large subunit ribosomal protein L13e